MSVSTPCGADSGGAEIFIHDHSSVFSQSIYPRLTIDGLQGVPNSQIVFNRFDGSRSPS